MGMIQEYQCPSCNEIWKVATGHGFIHGSFERVLEVFHANIQAKILKDANGDKDPLFQFHYRPALCRDCHSIVAVPVFRFLEHSGVYVTGCPKCGSITELIEDNRSITCPKCGKGSLSTEEIGCWD